MTWNPSDTHINITLSAGNTVATKSSTAEPELTRSTIAHSTGKWCFECAVTIGAGGDYILVGVMVGGSNPNTAPQGPGDAANGWGYYADTGELYTGNVFSAYGDDYTDGDVITVYVDFNAGKGWFAKNGTVQASGNPATGANPAFTFSGLTLYAAASLYYPDYHAVTGRFSDATIAHPIAGYTGWDDDEPPALLGVTLTPSPLTVDESDTAATSLDTDLASGASIDSTTYESSDEDVATVDSSGVVTGVAAGVCTVTVEVTASGTGLTTNTLSDTINVTVEAVEPPEPPEPPGLPVGRAPLSVVVVQLTIGDTTHHYSDIEYGDPATAGGIGTRWHDARVVGDIAYSRVGEPALFGGRARGGLGNIELINVDGALDALVTGQQADASVAVYVVDQDQPMSTATQIAAAMVTSIEARGEQTIRIVTRDVLALLDIPLQESLYASGDGVDTLIGRPRPVAIGKPLSCPVVLVDDVDYLYDVHDSAMFEVDKVRDSGIELALGTDPGDGYKIATATGIHGIELLQTPVGRVVVDVDATTAAAESIIGAAEGDFASDIADWDVSTVTSGGGTASATWDAGGFALLVADKSAVSSGVAAVVEFTFPTALVAGATYSYSLAYDVTVSGDALLQAQFLPNSLEPSEYINFGYVTATGTGTLSGTFVAPVAGKFRIRAAASSLGEVSAEIDTVRLSRVASGGDVADLVEQLLARAGIGVGQVDTDTLDALRSARPWACSYWADGAQRIVDVIQQLMDSVYGWMYTNAAGQIAVDYLRPPEAADASVLEITATELAGEVEVEPDLAPGLSATVAGARNWYRYGEGELADAVTDADRALLTADYRIRRTATDPVGTELRNRAGAVVSTESESGIPTLLEEAADIAAAADYLADLYPQDTPRRFYRVPVFLSRAGAAGLNPGAKITLTHDRYGCDAGRALRVVAIEGRAGEDLVTLRCWGSAVD